MNVGGPLTDSTDILCGLDRDLQAIPHAQTVEINIPMLEGMEVPPHETEIILAHLQQIPTLDRSNFNINIVEVGRFRGRFTQSLRRTWPSAAIFTIDDEKQLIEADPLAYAESIKTLAQINATVIRTTSPPLFPWPQAWSYDLLVMDIGSNFDMIRINTRWWSHSARLYSDGTRGVQLINLPTSSIAKQTARELFTREEGITVEEVTRSWSIVRYT